MESSVEKVKILVRTNLTTSFAISTEEGEKLFNLISRYLDVGSHVTLDFSGVNLIISTFLNAAIGQLYSRFTTEFIRDHLMIENMKSEDLNVLKKVTDRAKEYFRDQRSLDKIIKNHFPDAESDSEN